MYEKPEFNNNLPGFEVNTSNSAIVDTKMYNVNEDFYLIKFIQRRSRSSIVSHKVEGSSRGVPGVERKQGLHRSRPFQGVTFNAVGGGRHAKRNVMGQMRIAAAVHG